MRKPGTCRHYKEPLEDNAIIIVQYISYVRYDALQDGAVETLLINRHRIAVLEKISALKLFKKRRGAV